MKKKECLLMSSKIGLKPMAVNKETIQQNLTH